MRCGEVVTLPAGSELYFVRTDAELDALHAADAAAGRFHDDAGESIIYSRIRTERLVEPSAATVLRTRGVKWLGWRRRPRHLREVLTNLRGVPVVAMAVIP